MAEERVWINTADAARVYGIAQRTVRKRIDAGELEAMKMGGAWMVSASRAEVVAAGIAIPDAEPDGAGEGPTLAGTAAQAAGGHDRAAPGMAVDLSPLVALVEQLTRENREAVAAAAMYQERARVLEERLDQTTLALASGVTEEEAQRRVEEAVRAAREEQEEEKPVSWWRRLFGA